MKYWIGFIHQYVHQHTDNKSYVLSADAMAEEHMREPAGLDGLPPLYSIIKGEVRF